MWEEPVPSMRTDNDTPDHLDDNFNQPPKHNKISSRGRINTNLVEFSRQEPSHTRNNSEGTYVESSPMTPQDIFNFGTRYLPSNNYPSYLDPDIPFAPPPDMPVPPTPTSPASLKGPTRMFANTYDDTPKNSLKDTNIMMLSRNNLSSPFQGSGSLNPQYSVSLGTQYSQQ
ncbi:hypothetical protein HK096_010551, partial [Nowakowskiella sp. JEL0078]